MRVQFDFLSVDEAKRIINDTFETVVNDMSERAVKSLIRFTQEIINDLEDNLED